MKRDERTRLTDDAIAAKLQVLAEADAERDPTFYAGRLLSVGKDLAKEVGEARKGEDRMEATVKTLAEALGNFMFNGHNATTIGEGKHSPSGYCATCSNHYAAGMDAFRAARETADVEPSQIAAMFAKAGGR